jgi:hypothetical protein
VYAIEYLHINIKQFRWVSAENPAQDQTEERQEAPGIKLLIRIEQDLG